MPAGFLHPAAAWVLVLGTLLSLLVWWGLARSQSIEADRRFGMQMELRQLHLTRQVEHLLRLARSFQGLFLASHEVSAQEFSAHFDVLHIDQGLPEVMSVRYEDCGEHAPRDCAAPIYLQGRAGRLPPLPEELAEIDADSRDRNLTVMHPPLRQPDGRVLLQLSAPIYRGGQGDPGSVERRRALHAGHVRVLIDAARLLDASHTHDADTRDLHLLLNDVGRLTDGLPQTAWHPIQGAPNPAVRGQDLHESTFEVGGRLWHLGLERDPVDHRVDPLSLLVLFAGLALTVSAAVLVGWLQQRARRSEAECRRLDQIVAGDDERLRSIARHDGLTGLYNREAFQDLLASRLRAGAPAGSGRLVLMLLDLDRFQKINETLGPLAGDQVLSAVGERLRQFSGESVLLARLGGDEFALLFQDPALVDEAAIEAHARDLLAGLGQPLQLGEHTLRPGGSLGIAWAEGGGAGDATDDIGLMTRADSALHQAKRAGRSQFRIARAGTVATIDGLRLEADLHHALERHELELHFQPQFDGRTLQVVGAEALLRWRHPRLGMVPPDRFIPLAEESGLIVPIGRWVIDEACRQAVGWSDLARRPIVVAVNVSVRQVLGDDIVEVVAQALARHALPAQRLELEITESLMVGDVAQARQMLSRLHALGVSVAIDDFGVGYSSLAYLRDLPVQRFKIDRSFLRQVPQDGGSSRLVGAMVSMARALEVGLVAEGVETIEQLDFLCEQGCDVVQGYLLGRPIPGDDFLHRLMADDFGHRGRNTSATS